MAKRKKKNSGWELYDTKTVAVVVTLMSAVLIATAFRATMTINVAQGDVTGGVDAGEYVEVVPKLRDVAATAEAPQAEAPKIAEVDPARIHNFGMHSPDVNIEFSLTAPENWSFEQKFDDFYQLRESEEGVNELGVFLSAPGTGAQIFLDEYTDCADQVTRMFSVQQDFNAVITKTDKVADGGMPWQRVYYDFQDKNTGEAVKHAINQCHKADGYLITSFAITDAAEGDEGIQKVADALNSITPL